MVNDTQKEIDERANLTSSNKFELLLFHLGKGANSGRPNELFGINVFKIREIMAMPELTEVIGAAPEVLGVVNLRGQVLQVIDLPKIAGRIPEKGLNIMLVTEFCRKTIAFAVESVEDIVRLEWTQVLAAEGSTNTGLVTSIARLDGNTNNSRLVQVLDVEAVEQLIMPKEDQTNFNFKPSQQIKLKPGAAILAADDSQMARTLIERALGLMGLPIIMTRSGQEAWDRLQLLASDAQSSGMSVKDRVPLILTDLEMPEMDGFTLTRQIKQDARFAGIPVLIHSSLSGVANEEHVRSVGADGYVPKFAPEELAESLREMLQKTAAVA